MNRLPTDILEQIVGLLDVEAAFEFAQLIENDLKYQEVFQIIRNNGWSLTITNTEQAANSLDNDTREDNMEIYSLDYVTQMLYFFNKYSIQLYLEAMEPSYRYDLLKAFLHNGHKIKQIRMVFQCFDADDLLLCGVIGDKIDDLEVDSLDSRVNITKVLGTLKSLRCLSIGLKGIPLIDLSNTKLTKGLLDDAQIKSLPLSLSSLTLHNCDLTHYDVPIPELRLIELINCTKWQKFIEQLLTTANDSLKDLTLLQTDVFHNLRILNALLSCPNIERIDFSAFMESALNFSIIPRQIHKLKVFLTELYTVQNNIRLVETFANLRTFWIKHLLVNGEEPDIHFPRNLKCLVIGSIDLNSHQKLDWKYIEFPTELE